MHRDQERARRAFAFTGALDPGRLDAGFASLARELPSLLQRNGLLATWAFCLAKSGRPEHGDVLDALRRHLEAFRLLEPGAAAGPNGDVLRHWLGTGDHLPVSGRQLRRLTAESIEFAGWLKRAAESLRSGASTSGPDTAAPPAGSEPVPQGGGAP